MAKLVQDDQEDFDWDLSLEDEELLAQLADNAAAGVDAPPRPPSACSDITVTTIDHPRTSRSAAPPPPAHRLPPQTSNLKADIQAAFPPSPWTETIDDLESVADTTSVGPPLTYHHGASVPRQEMPGCWHVSDDPVPATYDRRDSIISDVDEEIKYPDCTRLPLSGHDWRTWAWENQLTDPKDYTVSLAMDHAKTYVPPKIKTDPEPAAARPKTSPLAQFRTFPKKPFSVSDFTAAVWCEKQQEFSLTRHRGRKPTTPAMRAGTKIHRKLEREVFKKVVRIDVLTKEDAFGLRLWNIVQGLRKLREEGLTRELEVWGLIDGHVVNGLIDGLSVHHPDPDFEEEILSQTGSQQSVADQERDKKITDFFSAPGSSQNSSQSWQELSPRVWLFDVKTRGHWSIPNKVHLRPTLVQLFLYHKFLVDMAAGKLDLLHIYRRYNLNADKPFSDLFLAQIGALHDEVFQDPSSSPPSPSSSQDSTSTYASTATPSVPSSSQPDERLNYRSLRQLVPLLRSELKATFPRGAASVGPVVTVEYRFRGNPPKKAKTDEEDTDDDDPSTGGVIGHHTVNVSDGYISEWVESHMEWWRGERPASGVPIEEADKCRQCSFADDCDWRAQNHIKALEEARQRKAKQQATDQRKKFRGYG